nr:MAG TPA: DNA-directed RNA polymerase subunit alpha [Caudoviricetes sp.]
MLWYSQGKRGGANPLEVERGEADEHNRNHCVTYACYCGYQFRQQPKEITALRP